MGGLVSGRVGEWLGRQQRKVDGGPGARARGGEQARSNHQPSVERRARAASSSGALGEVGNPNAGRHSGRGHEMHSLAAGAAGGGVAAGEASLPRAHRQGGPPHHPLRRQRWSRRRRRIPSSDWPLPGIQGLQFSCQSKHYEKVVGGGPARGYEWGGVPVGGSSGGGGWEDDPSDAAVASPWSRLFHVSPLERTAWSEGGPVRPPCDRQRPSDLPWPGRWHELQPAAWVNLSEC